MPMVISINSILSLLQAITLAYVESTQEETESTPIVSIPRADLATQRPEVSLLMEIAGIVNASSNCNLC